MIWSFSPSWALYIKLLYTIPKHTNSLMSELFYSPFLYILLCWKVFFSYSFFHSSFPLFKEGKIFRSFLFYSPHLGKKVIRFFFLFFAFREENLGIRQISLPPPRRKEEVKGLVDFPLLKKPFPDLRFSP